MVTLNGATADLRGNSTDEKPANVEINTIFVELDTGDAYYYNGTVWVKVGG